MSILQSHVRVIEDIGIYASRPRTVYIRETRYFNFVNKVVEMLHVSDGKTPSIVAFKHNEL